MPRKKAGNFQPGLHLRADRCARARRARAGARLQCIRAERGTVHTCLNPYTKSSWCNVANSPEYTFEIYPSWREGALLPVVRIRRFEPLRPNPKPYSIRPFAKELWAFTISRLSADRCVCCAVLGAQRCGGTVLCHRPGRGRRPRIPARQGAFDISICSLPSISRVLSHFQWAL